MKIIEKETYHGDGSSLRWHAVIDVSVDTSSNIAVITFGSWQEMGDAVRRTNPIRTGSLEVVFGSWTDQILFGAADFLASTGELAGGSVIDLSAPPSDPSPPSVTREFAGASEHVFDVGVMP